MKKDLRSRAVLIAFLVVMAGMIGFAVFFQDTFISLLKNPALLRHARFLHIAATALFFSNAVLGMIWERRSLASGSKEIILHTYNTVAFLDALFSSPLIILSLLGGLSLSFNLGDLWQTGWLSVSFLLFLLSGVIWMGSDIPTQYKVKRLMLDLGQEGKNISPELIRLLNFRLRIGIAGVLPLFIIFVLMVYKPEIKAVADWFR
ncbi:MAG: DUF2269 family protein [Coriobacteriaceae bacterium]|nr:DUF2269 family protein [Coriobacteriaceae bacterium]